MATKQYVQWSTKLLHYYFLPQLFPSERVVISPRELVIFDLRPEEEGFYFCMAKNELGEITSRSGQLNVWSESNN